jgi:hypothetical protein
MQSWNDRHRGLSKGFGVADGRHLARADYTEKDLCIASTTPLKLPFLIGVIAFLGVYAAHEREHFSSYYRPIPSCCHFTMTWSCVQYSVFAVKLP